MGYIKIERLYIVGFKDEASWFKFDFPTYKPLTTNALKEIIKRLEF